MLALFFRKYFKGARDTFSPIICFFFTRNISPTIIRATPKNRGKSNMRLPIYLIPTTTTPAPPHTNHGQAHLSRRTERTRPSNLFLPSSAFVFVFGVAYLSLHSVRSARSSSGKAGYFFRKKFFSPTLYSRREQSEQDGKYDDENGTRAYGNRTAAVHLLYFCADDAGGHECADPNGLEQPRNRLV